MKKISIFFVIVLLGCQDVITPTSLSSKDVSAKTNGSNLRTGDSNFLSSLTDGDRNYILSNLERSGHSLTLDQLDWLIRLIDASIPVVQSLRDELPQSLRDANSGWAEIIRQDSEAAAFALQVNSAIQGNLTTDGPPLAITCDTGIYLAVFLCLRSESSSCKTMNESCLTLGHLVETIRCIYGFCTIDGD